MSTDNTDNTDNTKGTPPTEDIVASITQDMDAMARKLRRARSQGVILALDFASQVEVSKFEAAFWAMHAQGIQTKITLNSVQRSTT